MSQLFISHSSRNNAEAVALRDWMTREGWSDVFLDVDPLRGIAAGERWERSLNHAAKRCEAVLFLVSRDWLASDWCLKEFGLAHRLNKRLFGLLIEAIPVGDLPVNLTSTWQFVNLAAGRDHVMLTATLPITQEEVYVTFSTEGLLRLRAGLRRAGLDPSVFSWPPGRDPKRSPYPGLRPLEAEDAGIFFGREAPTIEVLDRMRALRDAAAPRLLCILGASGSGKSSFLRAGLWPRLARDDRAFLPLPVLRPERAAITGKSGFASVLAEACEAAGLAMPRADIRDVMDGGAAAIRPLLARIGDAATEMLGASGAGEASARTPLVVLPIDQGEELFLSEGAPEAETLLQLLHDLLIEDGPAILVLMTIRSDAVEQLQLAPALEGIGPLTTTLSPMPRGVYGAIIEGPAARMREAERPLAIDAALTRALLDDMEAGGARDALPLLAFTLERLWLDYGPRGRLTLADYDRLGRVRGSIEAAVEEALRKADADPRIPRDRTARLAVLRRGLVPWLAGIDPETGSPRRRVARHREIPDEARPLIDLLVEERLLSSDVDQLTGEATIEPAHEALLRQWGLLQGWLDEDFAALAAIEGVRRATRDWGANGRDPAWLAHGSARLAEVQHLSSRPDLTAQFGPAERDYLAACRTRVDRDAANERRFARQRRWLQWGSIAAALVFAGLGIVAGLQWREAAAQRTAADAQRVVAVSETARATDRTAEAERQKTVAEAREADAKRNQAAALSAISSVALAFNPAVATKLALAAWPRTEQDLSPKLGVALDALAAAVGKLRERKDLRGHEGAVQDAEFSADGIRIVTASDDHTARLWNGVTGDLIMVLRGHTDAVTSAVFSPDGSRVLTASADQTARLWDAATGRTVAVLEGHESAVDTALFSPNGSRVLTVAQDKLPRLWDAASGRLIAVLQGHTNGVETAVFSPDGTRILTGAYDNTARIWDAATGASLAVLVGHTGSVTAVAFSPDGTRLVTGSDDNTARLWDSRTGETLVVLRGHRNALTSAVFSPDGTRVLTASADGEARLWDAQADEMLFALQGHGDAVRSAVFSPDGTRIATASSDNTARLWNAATGDVIAVFRGHTDSVTRAVFSSDGARVLTASYDRTSRLWNATTSEVAVSTGGSTGLSPTEVVLPGGSRFVTSSAGNTASLWEASDGRRLALLEGHTDSVSSIAASRDGTRLLTASTDGTARLWDAATGKPLVVFKGHTSWVLDATLSTNGAHVLTASIDKTARVWDAATGTTLLVLRGHGDAINTAVFSPDGTRALTASKDKTARIWDATTGATLVVLQGHMNSVGSAAFSPDGTRVLTASSDGTARIWETRTGNNLMVLRGHANDVMQATFSSDGTRIATASLDGTARIWNAFTGEPIAVLRGHSRGVYYSTFSPDGTRLLTASEDGTARLWDLATSKPLTIIRGQAGTLIHAIFSPEGTRILTSQDGAAQLWDISTIPRGNLFQVACAWLPDTDLSDIAKNYGLTGLAPICQGDLPLPVPLQH